MQRDRASLRCAEAAEKRRQSFKQGALIGTQKKKSDVALRCEKDQLCGRIQALCDAKSKPIPLGLASCSLTQLQKFLKHVQKDLSTGTNNIAMTEMNNKNRLLKKTVSLRKVREPGKQEKPLACQVLQTAENQLPQAATLSLGWTCPRCTFHNVKNISNCGVCEVSRDFILAKDAQSQSDEEVARQIMAEMFLDECDD